MEQEFFRISDFCQKFYRYSVAVGKFNDLAQGNIISLPVVIGIKEFYAFIQAQGRNRNFR